MIKELRHIVAILFFLATFSTFSQTTVTYTADSTMSDAMVANGGLETYNFGSSTQISTYFNSGQQIPMVFRTYIQYDLSAIPENAIILNANLNLIPRTVSNLQDHPLYIERVEYDSWTEGSITWNNQSDVINSTADRIAIPHSQTISTTLHQFDVTSHVQKMVNYPDNNNGWRIRLQEEQQATRTIGTLQSTVFGMQYYSSEESLASRRPYLTIEYILPINIDVNVSHCKKESTNGALTAVLSGGSSYDINDVFLYKTIRDSNELGAASLPYVNSNYNVLYSPVTKTVTAENLEPGVYVLKILDDSYASTSNPRCISYKHILVGRMGELTKGILMPNSDYQENTTIAIDKPTNNYPIDRSNTNYHSTNKPLRVSDYPNYYEHASLIKYQLDFDDQLVFETADLNLRAWSKFYRGSASSNAVLFSMVTGNWDETIVTWNTRPATDTNYRLYVPTTTPIGYDNVHIIDTVDILSFVEYWQANPADNYGFEMALESYGGGTPAIHDYKPADSNNNFLEIQFYVEAPILETVFDDETNTGNIIVNAPVGSPLPYKYLINTSPLGTLAQVWEEIGDWSFVDSIDFFTADINTTEYTFTGLPSGKYYVGVYDNNGTKILDGSGVVNTDILLANSTNLDLSSANELTRSPGVQGSGTGRLYAELLDGESFGGMSLTVTSVGEFYIGFNKSAQAVASSATDFEFGLKVAANGTYQIVKDNTLLPSVGSISANSKIDLIRDHGDYILLIDGTESHRGPIVALDGSDVSIYLVLVSADAELELVNYYGKFKRPGIGIKVDYPECGEYTGDITILQGIDVIFAWATLVNNHDATSYSAVLDGGNYVVSDIPIGSYTLTTAYSVPPIGPLFGYSVVVEEQVAIGYVVEWEEMSGNYVSPLNTIQKGPGPVVIEGWATANSTNITSLSTLNWVQYETEFPYVGPFTSFGTKENMILRNLNGDIAFVHHISHTGSFAGVTLPLTLSDVSKNGVWRLENDASSIELFYENVSTNPPAISTESGPFELAIKQNGNARFVKTIASFCSNYPIPDQFVTPKREIIGGYYVVREDNILKFEFYEEYAQGTELAYVVRDFTGAPQAGLGDLTEEYGDNRFSLDVSTLTSGVYIMEIINDKGENWFIRFKV